MLCYHYPPANNGGVERSRKFAQYLPLSGWTPHVLTTDARGTLADAHVTYTSEPLSLYRRMNRRRKPLDVTATSAKPAGNANSLVNRIARALLIPDVQIGWTLMALRMGRWIVRQHHVDVIYSSTPPPSVHLLGYLLSRLTGKPWVMDLRDPWTIEPQNVLLRRYGWRLAVERWLERLCFRRADAIILNTPRATAQYAERYPMFAPKMHTITNGFDADDMARAAANTTLSPWRPIPPDAFVISHTGAFYRSPTDDPTPHLFLDALKRLYDDGMISAAICRVVFAGPVAPRTLERIVALGLDALIDLPGMLMHDDALRLMLASDLLLLYDPAGDGTTYVRGKLYEYLASSKPILGIMPDGATRDLLARSGRGLLAAPDELDAVVQHLRDALAGQGAHVPSVFALEPYERKTLTRDLAAIFDSVTTSAP